VQESACVGQTWQVALLPYLTHSVHHLPAPLLTPPSWDRAGSLFIWLVSGHFADRITMATYSATIIAIPIRRESKPPALSQCRETTVNPSSTEWVQDVPRSGIFLNNSRWYRVTILPIFLFVHWSPKDTKYHSAHIFAFYVWYVFFLNLTVPMEGALFVLQLRAEKQTGNTASAQNECERTTLSRQFK
jgi:hypothetical protein